MRTNQEPQEILTERPHDINNKVYEKNRKPNEN